MISPSCATARWRVACSFINLTASMSGRSPWIATNGLRTQDCDLRRVGIEPVRHHIVCERGIGDKSDVGLIVRHEQGARFPFLHQPSGLPQGGGMGDTAHIRRHMLGNLRAGEDLTSRLQFLRLGSPAGLQFGDAAFQHTASLHEILSFAVKADAFGSLLSHVDEAGGLAQLRISDTHQAVRMFPRAVRRSDAPTPNRTPRDCGSPCPF